MTPARPAKLQTRRCQTLTPPNRALHRALSQIADAHPQRLAGWLANEPGHWGFFAGQAVLAVRTLIGRRLTEPERRYIWHQMWQTLEQRRPRHPCEQ